MALSAAISLAAKADQGLEFRDNIRPVLKKHCFECHNPKKKKGDLDLTTFVDHQQFVEAIDLRKELIERVQAYEMPPEGHEMADGARMSLLDWFRALPKPEKTDCNEIASDRTAGFYQGYVMSRRLNRSEYSNTMRDLVGVDLHLEDLLPADGGGGEGFDTTGSALFTSSIHVEKYLAAAELAVDTVLTDNTKKLSSEIKKARQQILISTPSRKLAAHDAGRKVVETFGRRAFRRPLTSDEAEQFLSLFDRSWQRGDGYIPSLRLALKGILISPHFLFLIEPEPPGGGVHKLEPFPLASRLSYFLWSTMPDEELFKVAESGKLLEEHIYRQQIRRMLTDPKAAKLGDRFALQWLDLEKLGTEVRPDPKKFPEFTDGLSQTMLDEVIAFFNFVVRGDRSLLELIDCNYTFMNQQLAELYGMKNISGPTMRKVVLNDSNRGGIVGMPAIHALTSYPLRTSPVLRGRWLLESLLGDRVPPPPPDVPALDVESEKTAHVSLRLQLEQHRAKPECAACHNRMDPLGFGLENFDVLGRWRTSDRGQPVDATGTLPSGQTFTGPSGLKKVLLERKDEVVRHLVRKMAGFAFGRELNRFDQCVVDKTMEALQKNEYRSSVLIEQIATSTPFRHRFYAKGNNVKKSDEPADK